MTAPLLIASYPRSGSTWLRFILCNLLYPEISHDFASVDRHIPYLDHLPMMKDSIPNPRFYKTHQLHQGQRVVFIHRHVGDVLISEYHYKRKYSGEGRCLLEYLIADGWGTNWRAHVNHYFPCERSLRFGEIGDPSCLHRVFPGISEEDFRLAISKSTFDTLQKIESEKGTGLYPGGGNLDIRFIRNGRSGQWREMDKMVQDYLIEQNFCQLKKLGY